VPLEWQEVKDRYRAAPTLTTATASRELTVIAVDDEQLYVQSSLWRKSLARDHLEEAVRLIEAGEMSRGLADFVEQYGTRVTKERRSLAAHVLKDLGFLE
jgi:hypothetical protein